MKKRTRSVSTIVSALAFGAVLAVGPGGNPRLSVDIWLVGTTAWLAVVFSTELLSAAPTDRPRLRLPVRFGDGRVGHPVRFSRRWPFITRPDPDPAVAPRSLVALEGALLASLDNPRAFAHRLRPRLRAVAEHRLRVHRGVDPNDRPDAAAAALGDVGWLIGEGAAERPPTVEELDRFLDLLEGSR